MMKNSLRQFDGDAASRRGAPTDAGLAADFLRGLECLLKHPVQHWTGEVGRSRCFIGGLHLADNFSLTEHHRIQTTGDAKEMANRFIVFTNVTLQAKIKLTAAERLQE